MAAISKRLHKIHWDGNTAEYIAEVTQDEKQPEVAMTTVGANAQPVTNAMRGAKPSDEPLVVEAL